MRYNEYTRTGVRRDGYDPHAYYPMRSVQTAADALNRASGSIYTCTLVTHYRIYRKRGNKTRHWLSQFAGMRLNDYLSRDEVPLLHAHSKDAAQEAFYRGCINKIYHVCELTNLRSIKRIEAR